MCFAYEDVDGTYYKAVKHRAVGVREPEEKEWGQKVGFDRMCQLFHEIPERSSCIVWDAYGVLSLI